MVFDDAISPQLARLCGSGAGTKRLSSAIFELPFEHRLAFLKGYLSGDGWTCRDGMRSKTASRDLASGLMVLAESVDWKAGWMWTDGKTEGKMIAGRHINDNGHAAMEFRRTVEHRRAPRTICHEGRAYALRYVKTVTPVSYSGPVWNLTVEGRHTFQTLVGMSHNTVKPIELMKWLVKLVTPPGGMVLDCFLGSGTTLAAARDLGFDAIGIELEADYVEIARGRLAGTLPMFASDIVVETGVFPPALQVEPVDSEEVP